MMKSDEKREVRGRKPIGASAAKPGRIWWYDLSVKDSVRRAAAEQGQSMNEWIMRHIVEGLRRANQQQG